MKKECETCGVLSCGLPVYKYPCSFYTKKIKPMKTSLKRHILNYLSGRNWVNGCELEIRAADWGYKPSNCGRSCRRLAQWGIIDRKISNRSVFYREIPIPVREPFGQLQCV